MQIETLVVGMLEANCYILVKGDVCLVVDPGSEYEKIKKYLDKYHPLGVLITHSHEDHVGALSQLLDDYPVSVYRKSTVQEKKYQVGPFEFQCLFTPGHTEDSISFYMEKEQIMFTGDFVFRGTIGRSDLPGGNIEQMEQSIQKLKQYPKDITLYSGHGDETTLSQELLTNPYF